MNNNNRGVVRVRDGLATVFEVDAFETRAVRLIATSRNRRGSRRFGWETSSVTRERDIEQIFDGAREKVARRSERRVSGISLPERRTDGRVDNRVHERAAEKECELVVAIGGRTTVDTGKCVAAMLAESGAEKGVRLSEVVGKAMPIERDRDRSWPYRRRLDRGRVDKK